MKFIKAGLPPNKREYLCGNCFRVFHTYEEFEEHWIAEHGPAQKEAEAATSETSEP